MNTTYSFWWVYTKNARNLNTHVAIPFIGWSVRLNQHYFMLDLNIILNLLKDFWFIISNLKQPTDVLLRKGVLKICSKFTGEHPCRSAISIKLLFNFIEITLWLGCSPVNLLPIFRTPFPRNTSWWLLLSNLRGSEIWTSCFCRAEFPVWADKDLKSRCGHCVKCCLVFQRCMVR